MSEPYSNPVGPNLAPQSRQQVPAVAEFLWRLFVNSLRTFHGRLELVSRIFLGIFSWPAAWAAFVGLGKAARTRSGAASSSGTPITNSPWPKRGCRSKPADAGRSA